MRRLMGDKGGEGVFRPAPGEEGEGGGGGEEGGEAEEGGGEGMEEGGSWR